MRALLRLVLVVLAVGVGQPACAFAAELSGKVVGVLDGDTLARVYRVTAAKVLDGGSRVGPCTGNPLRWPPRKSA